MQPSFEMLCHPVVVHWLIEDGFKWNANAPPKARFWQIKYAFMGKPDVPCGSESAHHSVTHSFSFSNL